MTNRSPFRYFKTSPEIIRLAVMMYVRFPLSLRNVEDLLHERGIDISHETVRFWWNRFGPIFAAEIRKRRVHQFRAYSNWQWHLDEVFVRINGETHYLWRAVDHEGEVLERPTKFHPMIYKWTQCITIVIESLILVKFVQFQW
jgi:putative transposase